MAMDEFEHYLAEVRKWCEDVLNYVTEMEFTNEIQDIVYRINMLLRRLNYEHRDVWELVSVFGQEVEEIEKLLLIEKEKRLQNQEKVGAGMHLLPPLPYPYDALEPVISREIMFLHHDKHHRSYVEGLNKAEKMLKDTRNTGDYQLIKHWERELAFHGSGHYLHSIFWKVMSPNGGGEPTGEISERIQSDFGGFPLFKAQFSQAASKVEGSGWAILVYGRQTKRLEILQSEKHQNLTQWDTVPLLVLDVWEHSYYLQYKNNRDEYIRNWWNVVNWEEVNKRLKDAKV
ncbi:MAG: superoxide dismutase [Bacillaceae bacterium]